MRRRASETKLADYTRRSLRGDVSGRGFDSRRLHWGTIKPFGNAVEGLFVFELHPIWLSPMRFFVGTSGYSYKEWKGGFYPEKLPDKKMLSYYAQHFSTVEINRTFHRFPTVSVVETWAQQVPDSFRFALKARQTITHFRRLQNAEQQVDDFVNIAAVLKNRQGPLLFQLPPNFRKDVPRLEAFLAHLNGRAAAVFEFRHASWFDDEVFACLRAKTCALCISDEDESLAKYLENTSAFGYLRLRGEKYTDDELATWIKRLRSHRWNEAYVFFKHEDVGSGPKLAARFLELATQ